MYIKTFSVLLSKLLLLAVLLSTIGCDESKVRTLGATVGLRGQDVGNSSIAALKKLTQYEKVDYSQRQRMQILVLPPEVLALPPSQLNQQLKVERILLDPKQISNRIELYNQLTKAYNALQKLSDGNFGEDSQEAVTAFNTSLSKIKNVPQIPQQVSSLLSGVTGFIVDKKQANDIRRINTNLYILVRAHRELWEADRPVWTAYFKRVKGAYINNLRSIPSDRFDIDKLKKIVDQPFKEQYIVQMYKNQEESRIDNEISEIEDYFERVEGAFTQLEKGHIELAKQSPSYIDAIAELDSIVSIVEPVLEKK